MAYNPNIPQPTDVISQSQADILNNFMALGTTFDVNHIDFNAFDAGKHKFIQFPLQGSAPATSNTEIALFSQTSTLTSNVELAIRKQNNGTVYEISAQAAASGWSRLTSGILLKWGNFATVPGANVINFPVGATIPVFGSIFQVIISTKALGASDTNVLLNSFTTAAMTVTSTARTTTANAVSGFTYLAIGI